MRLLRGTVSVGSAVAVAMVIALGGCATAEDLTKDAVLDRAQGTWSCEGSGSDAVGTSFTIGEDGSFVFEDADDGDDGDESLQWQVKDQVIRAEVGPADDLDWIEIRNLDDLDVQVAEVTMAWGDSDPSDDDPGDSGEVPLDVSLRGADEVAIRATGPNAERFPSSPWTCTR